MDSVRSEYSEGSISSSRLDDGSGTGRASLTFSNSHSSRLSIDSAATRSDFVSNYERKFQERKAAKHKRSEKAKREKEKADRQELFSADLRRKAAREEERQARRLEMENWLSDPNELKRIELRSQKRSRDRMRTLKEWYAPATLEATEEVQPVFVAAMNQKQSNQERKKLVKPLLSKEAAALKDEEDREALETILQRQLKDFASKLEYVEHFTDPTKTVAKIRSKMPRRRRRIAREDMVLAPLGPARSNLLAAKSVANLPLHSNRCEPKLRASNSLQTLRPTSKFHVDHQEAADIQDDAEVEQYLLHHRKAAKQSYAAVKLQAMWRMFAHRRKYLPWRQRRTRQRRAVYELWVMTYRVGNRAQRSLLKKYFSAWHIDVVESLQLRGMELQLFRQAATQAELPHMVLNLVFTSDWEDERAKRMAAKAAEATKKKDVAPSGTAAFLGAFLSSAFADVESASDKGRSRVYQLRAQHVAAREEVRKKVVQHVFRLWKRVHEANKRVGLNAQLCLKRAVRMAFGTRKRWPAEILLSVFDIWARWASFNRCKRLGLPLPQFALANPQWDIWLHNYQERQVRCVKAAAKAPGARLRRFFLRLHAFARRTIRERHSLAVADQHYLQRRQRKALLEWREEIADSAAEKKLTRGVLLRFHRYAAAKRKLHPLKVNLRKLRQEWLARRAWRGWKRVELHACFKRELNLSRLENSQAWRSKLHRTLDIWRDERNSLLLYKTFEAWTHLIRKRKLFNTLRLLCKRIQRRTLLQGIFDAWKAAKWDRVDGFLEDSLRLDAWDVYRELSVFFPMMFYGSFSDAGSIFGGLPSHTYGDSNVLQHLNQSKEELLLSTSGDAIRHFHSLLTRESVVEVRNAILQTRHLVNAVDDSTGNTALHVAAQIEEPERRLEIISLLLSEGAATLKRVNRHGLSPVQLSPDADTKFLLDKGVFAFHSRNSLNCEIVENDDRLMWCMVTLMSREWGVGLRIPADVRTGQWHSTLREEKWLRQKHIRFSPDSNFAPAVFRSRGFLNALKTRLCISHYDLLQASLAQKQLEVTEDPNEAREKRYLEWEERSQTRQLRASETGSYEAYSRYILATTLDTEACEQDLIPSFVGLLFSLDFGVEEVLVQAQQLERNCATAEGELWTLYQRIQKAERAWSALFSPEVDKYDVRMLRLFSDDADADLFFRREIFLLDFGEFTSKQYHAKKNGMNIQQEALALEVEPLLIRTKRKLRKTEKKIKRIQDQIDESEREYREAVFASTRRVEQITTTRMALERVNLHMARNLLKLSAVRAAVERLDHAKQVLQNDNSVPDQDSTGTVQTDDKLPPFIVKMSLEERKTFLQKEMTRCTTMFQTKVTVEETRTAANKTIENELETEALPEALHPLQKEAVSKLHKLFILDLFRSCCCWLVDNMIATQNTNNEESEVDSEDSDSDQMSTTEGLNTIERKSFKVSRLLSSAGALLNEGNSRRRSSISNTRRVLETYHRGASIVDMLEDPDGEAMNATYAASAVLLFEEERQAAQKTEQERLSTKKVETVSTISEKNPITGEFEVPPNHIVDMNESRTSASSQPVPAAVTKEIPHNRKREELQRAMMHRRLQSSSDCASDDKVDSTQNDLLPVIHGTGFDFGNFVIGSKPWSEEDHKEVVQNPLEPQDSISTEAMWKRGKVKVADGSASSIKEVLAQAHRITTSREKLRHGSRQQGMLLQGLSEVSQPLEEVHESQPLSPAQRKGSVNPLPVETVSSPNEVKAQRQNSIVGNLRLARAASLSSLVPDINSISTVPVALTSNVPVLQDFQTVDKSPEQLVIPEIQINLRSRPSSAIALAAEPPSTGETFIFPSQRENFDQDHEMKDEEEMEIKYSDNGNMSENEELTEVQEGEKPEELTVDSPELTIQSPVVHVSLSESPTLLESPQTHEGGKCSVQIDSLATSVNAFIKWEDAAAFEAFPLQVVPSSRSRPVSVVRDRRNSLSRETGFGLKPLAKAETRGSDYDALLAMQFVLGDSSEQLLDLSTTNEDFTLHGKSFVTTKKQKRILHNSNIAEPPETIEKHRQSLKERKIEINVEDDASNLPDSLRQTPAITVSVVTKPVKQEAEIPEPPKTGIHLPTSQLPATEKLRSESPKPFVKFESPVETATDMSDSTSLQMEGTGLKSAATSSTTTRKLDGTKREQLQTSSLAKLPGTTRIQTRQSRSRVPVERLALSASDFTLQGARMTVPKTSELYAITLSSESGSFEGLSQATKEQLWQDFVSEPLSTTVHDAYTILYPQTYPSAQEFPASSKQTSCQPPSLTSDSSLSHLALRVGSTRHPAQKTIELDKKFWSAVEGYRAIGSSALIPLDAATIVQRRQDKAQSIYDQFFVGQRATAGVGDYRGLALAWLERYPKEVENVHRQLSTAPKTLFDELQRTVELQISAALAKHHTEAVS